MYCNSLYYTIMFCIRTVLYYAVIYMERVGSGLQLAQDRIDCTLHTVLHSTALYCTATHCTTLYCTVLNCAVLYCTALHPTALHCTALH